MKISILHTLKPQSAFREDKDKTGDRRTGKSVDYHSTLRNKMELLK